MQPWQKTHLRSLARLATAIDGIREPLPLLGCGSFINAAAVERPANADFVKTADGSGIEIKATRDIEAGEEVLCSYDWSRYLEAEPEEEGDELAAAEALADLMGARRKEEDSPEEKMMAKGEKGKRNRRKRQEEEEEEEEEEAEEYEEKEKEERQKEKEKDKKMRMMRTGRRDVPVKEMKKDNLSSRHVRKRKRRQLEVETYEDDGPEMPARKRGRINKK